MLFSQISYTLLLVAALATSVRGAYKLVKFFRFQNRLEGTKQAFPPILAMSAVYIGIPALVFATLLLSFDVTRVLYTSIFEDMSLANLVVWVVALYILISMVLLASVIPWILSLDYASLSADPEKFLLVAYEELLDFAVLPPASIWQIKIPNDHKCKTYLISRVQKREFICSEVLLQSSLDLKPYSKITVLYAFSYSDDIAAKNMAMVELNSSEYSPLDQYCMTLLGEQGFERFTKLTDSTGMVTYQLSEPVVSHGFTIDSMTVKTSV